MVRMAICAVRAERHHDVWFDAPDQWHDLSLRLGRDGAVQVPVDVIQKMNLADSQFLTRRAQFGLADFAHNLKGGPHGRISEAAAFPSCRSDEISLDTLTGVSCERPAHSQRFVVGMGQNTHQSETVCHLSWSEALIFAR